MTAGPHPIVFYDGVCGLCGRTVRFLCKRDRRDRLRFAPLQGPTAARLLPPLGGRPEALDTIYVLTAEGRLLEKSRAVLFAVAALGGAWTIVRALMVVPPVIADLAYDAVARVRYRLFGKLAACTVPSADQRARFVEASLPEG